jgi:parvulin-like peptidyl-prolyl isomerase
LKEVNDDNFEAYVSKHSGDTGSAAKGGDLGDFFFGDMVPQFATYVADKPIGEIGVVQTQFGFHIIQVTARKGKKYPRLAVVQKNT